MLRETPAAEGRIAGRRSLPRGAAWRSAVVDLANLLLPVECVGCGTWDVSLCERCAVLLHARLRRCEAQARAVAGLDGAPRGGALPTWCLGPYQGPVRGVVLAWKGRGAPGLSQAFARAGRLAGRRWWDELETAGLLEGLDVVGTGKASLAAEWRRRSATRDASPARLVVVPAPSGWQRRLRGRLVVRTLAGEVARGLGEAREPTQPAGDVRMADVLRRRPGRAHQYGLGVAARARNRRCSMRVVGVLPARSACLLVDDVLTTGATLAECRRALEHAGHTVLAALVLAATPAS